MYSWIANWRTKNTKENGDSKKVNYVAIYHIQYGERKLTRALLRANSTSEQQEAAEQHRAPAVALLVCRRCCCRCAPAASAAASSQQQKLLFEETQNAIQAFRSFQVKPLARCCS